MVAKRSAEKSKSGCGGIFRLGIAFESRSASALLRKYSLTFAVMDGINAYAVIPARTISLDRFCRLKYLQDIGSQSSPSFVDLRAVS